MNNTTKAQAFLVFLNNLYIDLNCNDENFLDILSNRHSKVFRIATLPNGPTISVSRSVVESHLTNFSMGLTKDTMNLLLKNFINENKIGKTNFKANA